LAPLSPRRQEASVEPADIRVLVVDDTEHVRQVVHDMLRLSGFDVVGVAGGVDEALASAQETDPHVVVMDLKMPAVDGIEGARRLRALRPEQLVVLYTAYLDAAIERDAAAAGVALCLPKVDGLPRLERELLRLTLGGPRR
jgi:DNA-binding NarL/FixJ family response regulator